MAQMYIGSYHNNKHKNFSHEIYNIAIREYESKSLKQCCSKTSSIHVFRSSLSNTHSHVFYINVYYSFENSRISRSGNALNINVPRTLCLAFMTMRAQWECNETEIASDDNNIVMNIIYNWHVFQTRSGHRATGSNTPSHIHSLWHLSEDLLLCFSPSRAPTSAYLCAHALKKQKRKTKDDIRNSGRDGCEVRLQRNAHIPRITAWSEEGCMPRTKILKKNQNDNTFIHTRSSEFALNNTSLDAAYVCISLH